MAGVGLAQWCQSQFRGAPSTPSGVHPGLWVHPGSAQCPRFSRKGLVWTYLTTQTSPDTVSHCSILREFLPLRKEVLFLLQEWRQLFFFFFNHLSSFGINPQRLVFFLQGEEGGAGWAFIPAGSCQTGLHAGQPQCSLAISLLHTLPQTVRTSLSWVPALPVPPFLC